MLLTNIIQVGIDNLTALFQPIIDAINWFLEYANQVFTDLQKTAEDIGEFVESVTAYASMFPVEYVAILLVGIGFLVVCFVIDR